MLGRGKRNGSRLTLLGYLDNVPLLYHHITSVSFLLQKVNSCMWGWREKSVAANTKNSVMFQNSFLIFCKSEIQDKAVWKTIIKNSKDYVENKNIGGGDWGEEKKSKDEWQYGVALHTVRGAIKPLMHPPPAKWHIFSSSSQIIHFSNRNQGFYGAPLCCHTPADGAYF